MAQGLKKSIIAILCLSTLIVSSMGITAVMHSDVSSGANTYGGSTWRHDLPNYAVDNEANNEYEASVNGQYYEDLGDAIEAAMGTEATVIVLKNCTLMHTFTITDGTNLTLCLNNRILTCEKTLFYVESGVVATLTIDTGNGTLIAPCVIDNHYVDTLAEEEEEQEEQETGFEAYITGNFICSEKAFVFEDAYIVDFENAHINSSDSAIWCSHRGCSTIFAYGTCFTVTGEDASSAVRLITRDVSELQACDIRSDYGTALEISASPTMFVFDCNIIGGAFDFQHDADGYLVGTPQAAVLINNEGCEETGGEIVAALFIGGTMGYVKDTFVFPPMIIEAAGNCATNILVGAGDCDLGDALCLFREGARGVTITFNNKEHCIPA